MSSGGKIDVPSFDNTISGYKEFSKRCMLYKARMKLEGKEKQVTLAILGQLTGIAWTACETLADEPDKLETEEAYKALIDILDKRFGQDKATELPDVFE